MVHMTNYTATTEPIAYAFQADLYCPECIRLAVWSGLDYQTARTLVSTLGPGQHDTERLLDTVAEVLGIDRYDENTFDSENFPKACFSYDVPSEYDCCSCHVELG